MDPAIFQFYLKRQPAEYAPIGSQLPPFEQILAELEHLHGRQRARDMGLVFLAQEILTYLPTAGRSRTLNPLLRTLPASYSFGDLADAVSGPFDESPLAVLPGFGPRRYATLQSAITDFVRTEVLP